MSTRDDITTTADSAELAGLLPGLPDLIKFANEVADEEGAQYPAAILDLARGCELLLAERERRQAIGDAAEIAVAALERMGDRVRELEAERAAAREHVAEQSAEIAMLEARRAELEAERERVTAERDRWKEATHKLASEADADTTEARHAAAMWQARYRESEEAHASDAAVLKALRGEVERLRAPAPAGGADREAELDRIAAAQRERMGATAPSDDMPDPDAFDPGDDGDIVSPEDADRAELLVSLLRRSTAELRALVTVPVAAAPDLAAARAAAREARDRAGKATEGPWLARRGSVDDFADRTLTFEWMPNGVDANCNTRSEEDGIFIAAARTDVPTLAAHVETLANEAERLRARVAELEAERGSREALALDDASMDRAWGKALDLIRSDGLDPDEVIARAIRTVEQMRPPAPTGNRVAALLAAVDARAAEAALDGGSFESGRSTGLEDAARFIAAHLGTPLPLDGVVAEVMALPTSDVVPSSVETIGDHAMVARETLYDVSGTVEHKRSLFVKAARVALAGIQACDAPAPAAAKGGA